MERREGDGQKFYAEIFTGHATEAVNPYIGQVCSIIQIWEPDKLELPSEIAKVIQKEQKTESAQSAEASLASRLCLSVNRIFSSVQSEWVPITYKTS